MKKSIRLFTTLMVCMAMALCVSCKKDDDDNEPGGGGGGTQTVATVTTGDVTDITQATAVCGGEVKSENGWAVTERGVCWGTEPNPTPSDNCTVDGEGVGAFTSEITGLAPGTKYYVRAYAKNAAGTGYGAERNFTTQGGGGGGTQTVATVTTGDVTDITQATAVCGGEVKSENGWAVTERGVCWGTEPNPTPSDNCTVDGEGVGAFTSEITGLEPDTKYYVRAYAKNAAGTGFGEQRSFTTQGTGGGGTQTVATVTTAEVTEITQTTATCGGEVKSENGWAVTERGVCWSTEPNPTPSDSHTVDGDGIGKFTSHITGLAPDTKYYVRAYAKNAAGTGFGEQRSFTTDGGTIAGHAYVDLGLPSGLLWATCNVGADKPEDYGSYYAWGETEVKSAYNWNTYKWCNDGDYHKLTKYNTYSSYGTVDNRTVLDPEDDAARANWGGAWRMPTEAEMRELKDNCTSEWTTQNGVNGSKFTGPNGESIFLPAAGYYDDGCLYSAGSIGYYWSSSLCTDGPSNAYGLYLYSGHVDMGYLFRGYGDSVRPVCPSQK